jgi:5'(3')-deoxyribonucleotidase
LIKKGYNVKILSTSPHDKADKDKMKWLIKHIPEMKMENVIFSRPKNKKIDYITKRQRKNSILIDDYGKNTTEWVENGGRFAIKLTEKIKEEKGVYFIKNIEETLEMIF